MKGMKSWSGLLAGLLSISVLLTIPAAAASGWEQFADAGKQALLDDIQKFIGTLKGDYVVNMQVSYPPEDGKARVPSTRIDKSDYAYLVGELQKVKLQAETAAGTDGAGPGTLEVTTREETVSFNFHGRNVKVAGSRGTAVFGASYSLSETIGKLDGVSEVLADLSRDGSRSEIAGLYQAQLEESGPLIGYNGRINEIWRDNPAALAVDINSIDTVQIYDGDETSVLATGKNDRIRLCNLVNLTRPSSVIEHEKRVLRKYDGMRLEFRMRDGSKHEYRMDQSSDNLIADGVKYSDAQVARLFDAVLADIFFRYPQRVAWLGYMNARRIVSATVVDGAGSFTYTAAGSNSKISEIAADLKAVQVAECIPYRRGILPAQVKNRTPSRTVTLIFDGGAEYHIAEYDGSYLTMEWVDQPYSYLYRPV